MNHAITGVLLTAALVAALSGCGNAETRKSRYFERGEQYLATHDYRKAAVEFRNALQIDPNFVKARIELGRTTESLGNPTAALGQYLAVVEAAPNNVEARVLAGRLYLMGGLPDKALELVNAGLATNPHNPQLLTVRGGVRERMGATASALADANEAYAQAPDDEYVIALLASLQQSSGHVDQAIKLVTDGIAKHPGDVSLREVLVNLKLANRDFAGAENDLRQLVQLEPDNVDQRYALAQFYMHRGDIDSAEKTLREAIAIAPGDDEPKLALVELLAGQRGAAAAQAALEDFVAHDPHDYGLKLLLGHYLEQNGHADQAERTYREVIERADSDPPKYLARDRLAALKLRAGQTAEAEQLVDAVLKRDPGDSEALTLRADLALQRGAAAAAIVDLRAALRGEPTSVPILRALARAYVANHQPALAEETLKTAVDANPKDAATSMQLVTVLQDSGKKAEARALLMQMTADNPGDLPAQEALFHLQAGLKDYVGARATAAAVIKAYPQQGIGHYLLGLIDQAEGKQDAALDDYQTALRIQPDGAEPLAALVNLELTRGHRNQALQQLDAVLAKADDNAVAHNLKGQILDSLGRQNEAMQEYRKAIAIVPTWWVLYQNLSRTQVAARQVDAAKATLAEGLKPTHDNLTLAAELAGLYELSGQSEQAIALYEGIVSRNPQSAAAKSDLAMLLVSVRGDAASIARANSLTASLQNSTNPSFQDTLGWVKYKSGDYQQALALLRAALAESPQSMLMHYHLGMAQLKTGDVTEARKNIGVAVSSGRPFLGVEDAKLALSQLSHNG